MLERERERGGMEGERGDRDRDRERGMEGERGGRERERGMEGEYQYDIYTECLRNFAASLGTHATDGCGEFAPDELTPGGMHCECCGCHRSFHRKVTVCGDREGSSSRAREEEEPEVVELVDYEGPGAGQQTTVVAAPVVESRDAEESGRKRPRTKYTTEQKEKMLTFCEKIGWRIRRNQDAELEHFCTEIGVTKHNFKVWMHNHKSHASSSSASAPTNALTIVERGE